MNKKELIEEIKKIHRNNNGRGGEETHQDIDGLLLSYIDLPSEIDQMVSDMCPWYA